MMVSLDRSMPTCDLYVEFFLYSLFILTGANRGFNCRAYFHGRNQAIKTFLKLK